MEQPNCAICGSTVDNEFIKTKRIRLVKCPDCSLAYLSPRPTDAEMAQVYDRDFFFDEYKALYGLSYTEDKDNISKVASRRLQIIASLRNGEKGELLDVGCATGFFLDVARDQGWQVAGVDVSTFAVDYARDSLGLDRVFQGELQDIGFENNQFNVATMWFVLEHSRNPVALLTEAHRILKPGGMLALAVPNIGGLYFSLFKKRWLKERDLRYFHFYDFSPASLQKALQRTGFLVQKMSSEGKLTKSRFAGPIVARHNKGNVLIVYAKKL
jgi:2-polyprenyl-3-methyl-5-hydroxy-6-metoxy-1,4-benzoquinol methylase